MSLIKDLLDSVMYLGMGALLLAGRKARERACELTAQP